MNDESSVGVSPRSRVSQILASGPSKVRKALLFGESLAEDVKANIIKRAKSYKAKKAQHRAIIGKCLWKYGLISEAQRKITASRRNIQKLTKETLGVSLSEYKRKKKEGLGATAKLVQSLFLSSG